eukprot:2353555-Rhodomonas_salina.4
MIDLGYAAICPLGHTCIEYAAFRLLCHVLYWLRICCYASTLLYVMLRDTFCYATSGTDEAHAGTRCCCSQVCNAGSKCIANALETFAMRQQEASTMAVQPIFAYARSTQCPVAQAMRYLILMKRGATTTTRVATQSVQPEQPLAGGIPVPLNSKPDLTPKSDMTPKLAFLA